ncbi:MAG: discoidin domain-containing protein [Elusimicrobiota bacterium]
MRLSINTILAALSLLAALNIPVSAQLNNKISSVTASSGESDYQPMMACDGDMKTRWGSDFADNQWIKYEFAGITGIRAVGIHWETAAAYSYQILVSTDNEKWQTAAEVTGELEGNYRKINFKKAYKVKYVMINCIERATQWGNSIWETEFMDKPYKDVSVQPTYKTGNSFFKIRKEGDIYWLVHPDGGLFLSKGVDAVVPEDGTAKEGSERYSVAGKFKNLRKWGASAVKRLKKLNFNTLGCWSNDHSFAYDLPFTLFIYVNVSSSHRLADVFAPDFELNAEQVIKKYCRRMSGAKYLIGYFLDNELPWYGDVGWYTGHVTTLLDVYSNLPSVTPGSKVLAAFFKERYRDIGEFNGVWGTNFESFEEFGLYGPLTKRGGRTDEDREEFAGRVAERYFAVMTSAIRKYDTDHLILGSRFANNAPKRVIEACGKYCDVISLNYYAKDKILRKEVFDNMYFLGKKPVMVTEFSYRAMENASGDRNTHGADVTVQSQEDRADGFRKYVAQLMDFPYAVGYHWFMYADESPQGRSFDGENSNYGIYDIHDNIYKALASAMTEVNSQAELMHGKASLPYPDRAK